MDDNYVIVKLTCFLNPVMPKSSRTIVTHHIYISATPWLHSWWTHQNLTHVSCQVNDVQWNNTRNQAFVTLS